VLGTYCDSFFLSHVTPVTIRVNCTASIRTAPVAAFLNSPTHSFTALITTASPTPYHLARAPPPGDACRQHGEILAHDLSPPSEAAANPAVNISLHRLSQVLQATLPSIADHDPSEKLERTNTNVEAGGSYQPSGSGSHTGTRPASEQWEQRPSDVPLLQLQSGRADSPQSNTETGDCPS
jgi:hypothetical protein